MLEIKDICIRLCIIFPRYYNKEGLSNSKRPTAAKKRGKEEGLRSLLEALRKRKSDLFDTLSMHGFDNVSLF